MSLPNPRTQWMHLPVPSKSFAGQTVIVTGSNIGLGLEAARHFTRLQASKVILAVRNIRAGEEAAKSIHESTGRNKVCEVWQVDIGNWESVKTFVKRAEGLERLDVVVENAGVAKMDYSELEGVESTIAVNVVGTFLMALGLLPILRASAKRTGETPRLTIVSSEVHKFTELDERKEDSIFEALNKNDPKYMKKRYPASKLLEVFMVRALAPRMESGPHANEPVILNMLNPGLCHSGLARDAKGFQGIVIALLKFLLARTTEVGSRTLLAAAEAGKESHGKYMSNCVIDEPGPFVKSEEGKNTQERVYTELMAILERIQPGISNNI
ncbi:short chain dehydrogenase atnD [Hyphodiscus hymeniophilus]|uniref:Short chain dehydrogenase atnD n=1 Tax=Hyphodiscus hymeniophilus TaxID=353542 RepID=A0A9P6VPP6_9HELO|nr:short chain dehydrogenase atnD [Hyphodiscus hymeniophilus]